jgi:hypothetical protein
VAEVPVLEEDRITIGGAQAWDRRSARLSCAGWPRPSPKRARASTAMQPIPSLMGMMLILASGS